jgi:hypothetical protein
MSLGTGIFLASIFLGLVYLFINTKDRWNWKKIILFTIGGIVALLAALWVGSKIYDFFDKPSSQAVGSDKPFLVQGFQGIILGEKLSEVEFRIPSFKDSDMGKYSGYTFNDTRDYGFTVFNDTQLIRSISANCNEKALAYPDLYSFKLHGLRCGDSQNEVFEKYGKENVRVSCYYKNPKNEKSLDVALRSYAVEKYGVTFILVNNRIISAIVISPELIAKNEVENWRACP